MIIEILNNKDGLFPEPKIREFTRKLLGDGLVTVVDEKKWRKVRTVANQAFHGDSRCNHGYSDKNLYRKVNLYAAYVS